MTDTTTVERPSIRYRHDSPRSRIKQDRRDEIRIADRREKEMKASRSAARYDARNSDCPLLRAAVDMAERGHGVMDVMTLCGVDLPTARRLVLGEEK